MALGIGGAAAAGLESGFNMGLRADEAAETRRRNAATEARQSRLDQQQSEQLARQTSQQDEDRALAATNQEMSDQAVYGAGLAAQYGGPDKIPGELGRAYATKAGEISTRRAALLRKRYQPMVDSEQQWAKDTASRIQTGQISMDDLSPADTVRLIQATSRRPVADFIAPQDGKSRVRQSVDDATAGLETKNPGLMLQGAGSLMAPELQTGLGHVTSDGSQIVKKDLYALLPAPAQQGGIRPAPVQGLAAALDAATAPSVNGRPQPQPLQPGTDPDKVMPVLQVTAQHPDGTEVTYHAPVTLGRGTGADDNVAPPLSIKDMMNRMGQLGTLEQWANTPKARAKIEQGLKDLGGDANSFLGAYYAMHGDAKALLPPGSEDPTSKQISAIKKLAIDLNVDFATAAAALKGKGTAAGGIGGAIGQKLKAIEDDPDLTPEQKSQAKRVAYGIEKIATPKLGGGVDMSPEAIDQTAQAALKDRTALVGIGRDPNKVTAVLNRMAEMSPGGDIAGSRALFGADKKSLDKMIPQYDAVTSFENNTLQQGKVLVGLAKKVDATGVPVIERWIRAGRQSIAGDADVAEFNAQLQLFSNEAAKILTNPNLTGVLSDSARHEVAGFLPSSASGAQIERVVGRLENDFEIRRKSIEDQVSTITKRMAERQPAKGSASGLTGGGGGGGGGGGDVTSVTGRGATEDTLSLLRQELGDAQQRLAKGDARAQGDMDALNREIAKVSKAPAPTRAAAAAPAGAPKRIATDADYNALPSGATFVGPDGKTRRKP